MVRNLIAIEHRFVAIGLSSALLICLGASAQARASETDLSIVIFADHYVLAERVIDDLDILEGAVRSLQPRALRLNACGSLAERAQRAAAHRFRDLSVELRWVVRDEPDCSAALGPAATPTSVRYGQRPYGIDDAAVDRWWHEQMP